MRAGQIVPTLDLRSPADGGPADPDSDAINAPPSNIEVEQALLGILLYDKEAFFRLSGNMTRETFYEPFHGRLFSVIAATQRDGRAPDIFTIAEEFRRDGAFIEMGGLRYLADLVDRAPPAVAVQDYETVLIDTHQRRQLLDITQQVAAATRGAIVDQFGIPIPTATLIDDLESALLGMQTANRAAVLTDLSDAIDGVLHDVQHGTDAVGVRTGLRPLDLQLGPMGPGDLLLLGGRPSMGKSGVSLSVATNIAAPWLADSFNGLEYDNRPAGGVIEVHGEMQWGGRDKGGQVARRHLADIAYGLYGKDAPSMSDIKNRRVTVDQLEMLRNAAQNLRDLPIRGVKRTGITIANLRSLARRQKAEWARRGIPLNMLIIDHVGLIRPDGRVSGRYEAQTQIAIATKELADELECSILALVQLSRDIERRDDKHPQLSDLRDSGAWEENADVVMFVYRDAYYAAREKAPPESEVLNWAAWDERRRSKTIEISLPKHREGEAGGNVELYGELAWNAVRAGKPDLKGTFL